jgi:hypothetical protein
VLSLQHFPTIPYYLFNINNKNIVIADIWIINSNIKEIQDLNYLIRLNNISNS